MTMSRSTSRFPVAIGAMGLLVVLYAAPAAAQHAHAGGGDGTVAEGAELTVETTEPGVMTMRLGPLSLPARSGHHEVAQPPHRFLHVPLDGWILSYSPRLTDGEGETLVGRLLHHVAFWNTGRSDFLCPNKEEHIFGAGGEMNEWVALPGVGYRVAEGDRIRVSTMFHNPTAEAHPEVYLEVRIAYQEEGSGEAPRKDVYPVWFDVQECGTSDYDLEPGTNVTTGEVEVPVSGRLLGVGGHLHDHGKELTLVDAAKGPEDAAEGGNAPAGAADGHGARSGGPAAGREIARLVPETDERGRILSMPVVPFLFTGGHALEAGDLVRVTARYENPTGRAIPEGAMGIVVGYFLPHDNSQMERFRRP